MNLNDKVMLGFEQNHSFSLVMLKEVSIHAHCTHLAESINIWWMGWIVCSVGQGNFTFCQENVME